MSRRALFLDRDGVINVDYGYVGTIDRFEFVPDVLPFLKGAIDQGYRLIVVTNQAGVARGLYTESDFQTLTAHMLGAMAKQGVTVDLVQACFFHEKHSKRPDLARGSYWRKPNPGMILEAARRLKIDLSTSAMIGDNETDMQAACASAIGTPLWLSATPLPVVPDGVKQIQNYQEARKILFC